MLLKTNTTAEKWITQRIAEKKLRASPYPQCLRDKNLKTRQIFEKQFPLC